MPVIEDDEFGAITIRKVSRSNSMRATVAPSGTLRLSVPSFAPMFMVKRMIASSRSDLRKLMASRPEIEIKDGVSVGKRHTLVVRTGNTASVRSRESQIIVSLPHEDLSRDSRIISEVRSHILAALRKEAKHHLPERMKHMAATYGLAYTSLRFTHASSRWGSCNSKQAISLNIALMNLPFELIDYVLIHELSHTVHLNHSKDFWNLVGSLDPDFKLHRTELKRYNPAI